MKHRQVCVHTKHFLLNFPICVTHAPCAPFTLLLVPHLSSPSFIPLHHLPIPHTGHLPQLVSSKDLIAKICDFICPFHLLSGSIYHLPLIRFQHLQPLVSSYHLTSSVSIFSPPFGTQLYQPLPCILILPNSPPHPYTA